MTTLDIIILIVFVASVIYGFRRGIILQAGGARRVALRSDSVQTGAPWLAGLIAGTHTTGEAPTYVDSVIANIIMFIAGFLGVKAVAHFFKNVTHALNLGGLDRIAGALFCMFEWMLVMSLLLNLWLIIKPQTSLHSLSTLGNGHAIEAIVAFAPKLLGYALG